MPAVVGSTRYFQAWYRDTGPTGTAVVDLSQAMGFAIQ